MSRVLRLRAPVWTRQLVACLLLLAPALAHKCQCSCRMGCLCLHHLCTHHHFPAHQFLACWEAAHDHTLQTESTLRCF